MTARKTVAEIYAELPSIACRGLCHASCGPVPLTNVELVRVTAARGSRPSSIPGSPGAQAVMFDAATMACPNLTASKRCGVYDDRPLVCRLFGVVDDRLMRCPHGCVPSRWLSNAEARELIALINRAEE